MITPLKIVGGIVGISVPVIGIVWHSASLVAEINDQHDRIAYLEERMGEYGKAQVVDENVNKQVDALTKEIAWISFHHHDGRAIGHDHEHDLIIGRGHVDGN